MNVVVVTGAASGMGRACIERLRNDNTILVAVDLQDPHLEGTVGVACDVTDPDAVSRLVERVSSLEPFASLVHAAGISPTMANPRRIFEVDLVGTQVLLDSFMPLVGPGSVAVCFASSAAHQISLLGPQPDLDTYIEDPLAPGFLDAVDAHFDDSGIAYAWAKRGVIRAAARASLAWGPRGGRVISLSPGMIDTGMGRQELNAQPMMQLMLDATPLRRLGDPNEIAATVEFLLSDAAAFLTGTDLLVDGGCLEGLKGLAGRGDALRESD
jgi:NAD(P)-dependent dehydrogenase (short-subunit alcohol dehydrogenase family)